MSDEIQDALISRIVDRKESTADWEQLAELDDGNGSAWLALAQTLRCEAELRGALGAELERADSVELVAPRRIAASLAGWSGWLTAAACLLGWILAASDRVEPDPISTDDNALVSVDGPSPSESEPQSTEDSAQSTGSQAEIVRAAADAADVIKELPLIIVDTQPAESGEGYEVVYLRRVLESRRVDEVLEFRPDDTGNLLPVPVDEARIQRPKIL